MKNNTFLFLETFNSVSSNVNKKDSLGYVLEDDTDIKTIKEPI